MIQIEDLKPNTLLGCNNCQLKGVCNLLGTLKCSGGHWVKMNGQWIWVECSGGGANNPMPPPVKRVFKLLGAADQAQAKSAPSIPSNISVDSSGNLITTSNADFFSGITEYLPYIGIGAVIIVGAYLLSKSKKKR